MPRARAKSSPCASARFEITTAICARSVPAAIASAIAARLLPRPEIKTASLHIGRRHHRFSTGGSGLFSTGRRSACDRWASSRMDAAFALLIPEAPHAAKAAIVGSPLLPRHQPRRRQAPLFTKPRDYRAFLDILREGLAIHPVPLDRVLRDVEPLAFGLGPTGTPSLSRLLHWVKTTHAVRLRRHREQSAKGPVYQARFKAHLIEEAGGLVRTCRYVERNALTAGLVKRAQDWPWGSLAERRRPDPAATVRCGVPEL